MRNRTSLILFFLFVTVFPECISGKVVAGAGRFEQYLPFIQGKRVGMVVNHTSVVGTGQTHLLDTLLKQHINVVKVFAPEHGFRGNADAGETVKDGKDSRTGVSIVSLYGNNKKPTAAQLKDIDVILFDIQDVGARFYTYISTMYYVMEACAENNKEMIVLDRPNPCDYVEGPILKPAYRSFVGMLPIPVLHGCTIGELARMINGEGWIAHKKNPCSLKVIPATGWIHGEPYSHKNVVCYGEDLRNADDVNGFTLRYFLHFYRLSGEGAAFFSRARWFDLLMGTDSVRKAILRGDSEETIRNSWQKELQDYKKMRNKYLLYE